MSPRAAARLEAYGFSKLFDYAEGKVDWQACGLPVEGEEAAMPSAQDLAREVPVCRLGERLDLVHERIADAAICVVVDDRGVVLGLVDGDRLRPAGLATAEEAMSLAPVTIRPGAAADGVLRRMDDLETNRLLVTRADGTLVGAVDRDAVERARKRFGA